MPSPETAVIQDDYCETIRKSQLAALVTQLIARYLSPGGSADLLAVSWFLANLDNIAQVSNG